MARNQGTINDLKLLMSMQDVAIVNLTKENNKLKEALKSITNDIDFYIQNYFDMGKDSDLLIDQLKDLITVYENKIKEAGVKI